MTQDRRIVLDTETTGSTKSDRVIELGMVEMMGVVPTGREYLQRFNPEGQEVHFGAFRVHGIRGRDLVKEPLFRDRLDEIFDFIGDAQVFIHNAPYDKRMLGYELQKAGRPGAMPRRICDTVTLASKTWPGQKCGIDALMERLLPGERRAKHNALEDCRILARMMPHFVPETDKEVARLLSGGGSRRQAAPKRRWPEHKPATRSAPQPRPPKPVPAYGTGMKEGVAEAVRLASSAEMARQLRTFGQDGWSGIGRDQLLEVLAPHHDAADLLQRIALLDTGHGDAALRWVCRGLAIDLAVDRERFFMEKAIARELEDREAQAMEP